MSDLQDFTQKNRRHTGASGIKVSNDGLSDGDRVNEKGRIRFNDSTDLMEYYNGSEWKPIDSPPVITICRPKISRFVIKIKEKHRPQFSRLVEGLEYF